MVKNQTYKSIYVVISSNDTLVGKLVKNRGKLKFWNRYAGDCYGHVSISLDEKLNNMMSFARKKINNPLMSGLIREDIHEGIFARSGTKSKIAVIKIPVSEEQYELVENRMEMYWDRRDCFKYDFVGLLYMLLTGRGIKTKNQYICSHWVGEVLQTSNVDYFGKKKVWDLRPLDYYDIFRKYIVYEGLTIDYKECKNLYA